MTKGSRTFEWSTGIPITDQHGDKHQNENNDIASTYENQDDDDITKDGEETKIMSEEEYSDEGQDEYPSKLKMT